MKKRILTMLLALVMVVSMLPLAASAAEKTEKGCNHSASDEKRVEVLEAGTCQTPGKVKYECDYSFWYVLGTYRCDEEWVKEEITVTCHTTEVDAKDATCTEAGNTAGITCTDCGQDKTRCAYCAEHLAEVIPAEGHEEVEIEAVEATCGNSGLTAGSKCDVCGEILVEQQIIPAPAEHDFSDFIRYTLEPTCKTDGKALYGCKTCDKEDELPVKADHLAEVVGSWEPTCSQIGCTIYRCVREGCGHVWYVPVEMLEHTEEVLEAVPAKCTTDGKEAGLWCTVCKEILEEQEVIPMLGHDWEQFNEVLATCKKEGHSAYQECKTCGTIQNKVVYPLSHQFDENNKCEICGERDLRCEHKNAVITIIEATCTEDGEETFVCPCGYNYKKTLPHPGHDYNENDVCSACGTAKCSHANTRTEREKSTCSDHGFEKTICEDCGKTVVSKTLPLADHNYVNGVCKDCKRIGSKNTTIDFQDIFVVG